MSRIRLRNLLNLTEQAPQASLPDLGSPVAAPVAPPPAGMNAGQQDQQPETPTDTGPQPEDPGEYDFTKDFREFEDKKNKAEAEAKKVVLDKMNEKLMGKTAVANASRGYGQPKTDYTIENIKKVSVEFWYKDYVVIVADENEKKYFLTPGINVKIEGSGSEPAPGQEQPAGQENAPGQEQPPTQDIPGEESPNMPPPATAGAEPTETPQTTNAQVPPGEDGQLPSGEDGQPAVGGEKPSPEQTPQPVVPQTIPQDVGIPPKKKKKVPVAEFVKRDLNTILNEFMSDDVKNDEGMVNFLPYVKESNRILSEATGATKVRCSLIIPENHMVKSVDAREVQLSAINTLRQRAYGQYSNGSIKMNKNGRYYLLEYVKEIGWLIKENVEINSLDSYYQTGLKCGTAQSKHDQGMVTHLMGWFLKAIRLEKGDYALKARESFNKGYREGSGVGQKPQYFR